MIATSATADGLAAFIDASPSPFHVCETVAAALEGAGYRQLRESDSWSGAVAGRCYVIRGGSIIAWNGTALGPLSAIVPDLIPAGIDAAPVLRIVGGHTDSPNLRVKQHPDVDRAGLPGVALEPYGGAWLNSWLDRDLGLSGRLAFAGDDGVEHRLVHVDEPVLRVPQLAIHLSEDRKGVSLNPQQHVNAVRSTGGDELPIVAWVARRHGLDPDRVLGWELMTHEVTPSRLIGTDSSLLSAPRLDNQGTCYAGLRALLDAAPAGPGSVPMLALFDHEEVGSGSERGAASDFLVTVCERLVTADGGDREDFLRTMARSICVSGDMAHGTHPNYPDRHEPSHRIALGGGPVLKVNQNLRYASDALGEAEFALACEAAGVPLQRYVHRADLPCGSTIGPLTATRTGLRTVDVGAPQLAMHSARELMAAADVPMYSAALQAFLAG